MAQTQFWFQSWMNNLMWSWTNQFWNFQTKQTGVSNTKTTTNTRFPWLNQNYIDEIEERTKNIVNYADKMQIQEAMYNDFYAQQLEDEKQSQRTEYKNQKRSDAINSSDKTQKQMNNVAVRTADLADLIRKKYDISLSAWTDDEVINKFVSQIDNWEQLMTDYLNWKNDKLLKKWWLIQSETFWQKLGDFGVWVLQSPWKFWYNLIWQWMDRAAKSMADKLQGSKLQERLYNKAVDIFWEDEVKAYQEQVQRDIDNWTIFNGREQTDIRTPILWEERANSKATKAWEVVWDIASTIALTAPVAWVTAPMYASASPLWAGLIWATEWVLGTAISSAGSSWEAPTWKELALWAWLWAAWWLLTRYLAQPKISSNKELKKQAETHIQKAIKPTVKWKQNQADFDKFIDDTMDSIDTMIKNKEALQYTDDAWNVIKWQLPTNRRELSEAIQSMKKAIWDEVDDITKQAWDVGAKVNLNNVYKQLDDIADDVAQNIANPQTKNIVEQYKNMLLQYTDDAGNISIDQAQKLTQNFNKQLTAFFKNPSMNDVSKNAIIAQMNKWVKDAINNWLDDALWNAIKWWSKASKEYTALKQAYGKLLTMEDEVSKSALVAARQNTKWLSQTMLDAFGWGDIAEALLTLNAWKAAKWATIKLIWSIYNYLNSPDRHLQQLFKLIENPNSTSVLREWLEKVAPYAADAWIWLMEWIEAQK